MTDEMCSLLSSIQCMLLSHTHLIIYFSNDLAIFNIVGSYGVVYDRDSQCPGVCPEYVLWSLYLP